jgi:hypothetical protein
LVEEAFSLAGVAVESDVLVEGGHFGGTAIGSKSEALCACEELLPSSSS